jgi:hypothetical protein
MTVSSYLPVRVFLGAAFPTTQDIRFRVATFGVRFLLEWLGSDGLQFSDDKVGYVPPAPIKVDLADALLSIERTATSRLGPFEAGYEEQAMVVLSAKECLSTEEWHERYFHPLVNLLTLATGQSSGRTSLRFWHAPGEPQDPREVPIEVLERRIYSPQFSSVSVAPHEMHFTYEDVTQEWELLMQKWFALMKKAGAAANLFFSVTYNPDMYVEQKFMSIVQALEVFHRCTTPNIDIPEVEHQKRVSDILTSVPENLRNWLKRRLSFSNEPNLEKRLTELVDATGDVVTPFLANKNGFIRRVVDTRNYLVHRNPKLQVRSVREADLWKYSFVLSLVMRAALLRGIMSDADRANARVRATPGYDFQAQRIRLG